MRDDDGRHRRPAPSTRWRPRGRGHSERDRSRAIVDEAHGDGDAHRTRARERSGTRWRRKKRYASKARAGGVVRDSRRRVRRVTSSSPIQPMRRDDGARGARRDASMPSTRRVARGKICLHRSRRAREDVGDVSVDATMSSSKSGLRWWWFEWLARRARRRTKDD